MENEEIKNLVEGMTDELDFEEYDEEEVQNTFNDSSLESLIDDEGSVENVSNKE